MLRGGGWYEKSTPPTCWMRETDLPAGCGQHQQACEVMEFTCAEQHRTELSKHVCQS